MLNIDQISSHRSVDKPLGLGSKSHAGSSLSLRQTSDTRARYYSLGHHDMIRLSSPPRRETSASAAVPSTTNFASGRRNQQRYKLLTEGQIQVCRVPHAKNIIEKIRFSRFLRRWEDHYLHLDQCEITSTTVRIRPEATSTCFRLPPRTRVISIGRFFIRPWKIFPSGRRAK